MMNKNEIAVRPPMGWNSWDVYGASINEEELLRNAEYISEHLKPYGWEYVVCDIQWYEPTADSMDYHDFFPLEMDAWSRVMPAVNRFPSAKDGKGFKPIADRIHAMGLKFGIHIMRGIPRQAVHQNTPILGTERTARQIAQKFSVCPWNTDMYGVNPKAEGAQEYYNSLFDLYASWGVDFVKVDDIANTEYMPWNPYSAAGEIEMIRKAIDQCGHPMVLSLSPGPAVVEEADHLRANANMWRMTGDFWDSWPALYAMFERCKAWEPYVSEGCWPDCDMLPLGHIALRNDERWTRFTKEEQRTMLTLWCIFRSPLMIGSELPDADDWTLSLLTNEEVLAVNQYGSDASQVLRNRDVVIWKSYDPEGSIHVALFNISENPLKVRIHEKDLGIQGTYEIRDLWEKEWIGRWNGEWQQEIPVHGAVLLKLVK